MICQDCGIEAATKYVSFHQNIGLIVVSLSKSVEGELCKKCIHRHFWSLSTTTFFLGWWGMISLILTPIFLLNNTVRYACCLGMPGVPPDAEPPTLTQGAVEKINPFADQLFDRMNNGEKLKTVVEEIAMLANVTPGQVILFIRAVIAAQEQQQQS